MNIASSIPPHDFEAEVAVLGSIMLAGAGEVTAEIFDTVTSGDFYRPGHGPIFDALGDLYAHGEPLELVALKSKLESAGRLDDVGDVPALVDILDGTPAGGVSGAYYAKTVADLAQQRRLLEACHATILEIHKHPGEAERVIAEGEERIFAVGRSRERRSIARIGDGINDVLARLERGEPAVNGIPCGFSEIDAMLGGLRAGGLYIMAGRPSMGKSALAGNMAVNIAVHDQRPALFISLEMSREEVRARALAQISGVSTDRMNKGEAFGGAAMNNLRDAGELLRTAPLIIDDQRGVSIQSLRARVRREVSRHRIEVLFVDYLQLISAPGRENRTQEVSEISASLKALAGELELPVIALSQLNRQAENRADRRPMLSDLRESGSIEQDADVVMLLYRESYYHRHDPKWAQADSDKADTAEIIIAKSRNGRTGNIELRFEEEVTRFVEVQGVGR